MFRPARRLTAIAWVGFCGALATLGLAESYQHQASADRNLLGLPPPVNLGFIFVVDSTGDGDNVGGGANCDDGTGHCTLRAAIQAANASSGDDSIQFNIPTSDPGYTPSVDRWTIKLSKALPDISTNIDIEGLGPTKLIVQRSAVPDFRIFNITTTGTATLSGLLIIDGFVHDNGGGVQNLNSGTLNVTNCEIERCYAASVPIMGGSVPKSGGGIYNASSGTINITNSNIVGNTGESGGGGIANRQGTLSLTTCTLSENTTIDGVGGGIANSSGMISIINSTLANNSANGQSGIGGGIYNSSGALTVNNSTFNNNFCASPAEGGGAITNFGVLNLTNSTLAKNFAFSGGGGIFNARTATVTNCTITGNSVVSGSGRGGGLLSDPMATVTSSIIALNTPDDVSVSMPLTSGGSNLIGKDSGAGFTAPSDHTGTFLAPLDPKLDPVGLRNNGGPTQTIALQAGSVAINNGDPTTSPPQDQRGFLRIGPPDIGAFEFGGSYFAHYLGNISTRGFVGTGDNVLIGGLIVTGTEGKLVLLRALGPTIGRPPFNVANILADPVLELHMPNGTVVTNDNWMSAVNSSFIPADVVPPDPAESAIFTFLPPGNYTAIVRGANDATGVALVEAYDLDSTAPSEFGNISTRGFVQTGDNIMIAGVIVKGANNQDVIVRGLGPTLAQPPFSVSNTLADPFLDLRDANGNPVISNDNWQDTQSAQIQASGYAPPNPSESAILITLQPGNYTALLNGVNNTTGNALVEVYALN